ncbi:exodeoxyribonuclease VII large subunit [[Bacteroides] pectinophilus]|uniref:Exodeoxyribonuclease 7 large subunit n=1 Tax=[Bacteroides] pectinophilus ATCC 43243 TaxID=483218 RepID=B7AN31_9FIRM|nr:exodeoxyribonuclease VII, large subunit [[Bacteroides] pectinophilus ATCC 43243]UWN94458.1 exodeoxyribonuclease VII large subunit [[Bacteroides] pectinophilus]
MRAYTVGQINLYIKNMFRQDFVLNKVIVRGEISNCKYHTSGHIYFTLKDETGTIAAVLFAGNAKNVGFRLENGMKVNVSGRIDIYERDGRYQLYVNSVEAAGMGDLYRRFEQLKAELEEMGMFAQEYKKPIPAFARKIGIVTASTGAAIQDIINISRRRNPYVQLILYPATVQGDEAKYSIVKGIRRLDSMGLDVIIAGRGGGSIEDLWAFNEECVARAIFDAATPIISAVGHETDFTIADFVADMRAPTPSAAAELAVADITGIEGAIEQYRSGLNSAMNYKLERMRMMLEQRAAKLKYLSPESKLNENRQITADYEDRLNRAIKSVVTLKRHELAIKAEKLHGLSPLTALKGGYAYVEDDVGRPVRSIGDVSPGNNIRVNVTDGIISACVTEVSAADSNERS